MIWEHRLGERTSEGLGIACDIGYPTDQWDGEKRGDTLRCDSRQELVRLRICFGVGRCWVAITVRAVPATWDQLEEEIETVVLDIVEVVVA